MKLLDLLGTRKPLIGMVHLPPLPGAPNHPPDLGLDQVITRALEDALELREGGAHGIMLENYGDRPFPPEECDPATTAAMAIVAREVAREIGLPTGVNLLRNCALQALAVAHTAGALFIRVNAYSQAIVTDQGLIQPVAHRLQAYRRYLGAHDILVLADVNVKHAAPLSPRSLGEVVEETLERGGADAVIITGSKTGSPPSVEELREAKDAAGDRPVLVGSGLTPENAPRLMRLADGAIVGTYFKEGGRIRRDRVQRLVEALRGL